MTLKLDLTHILDAILMIVKRDKSRASLLPARMEGKKIKNFLKKC